MPGFVIVAVLPQLGDGLTGEQPLDLPVPTAGFRGIFIPVRMSGGNVAKSIDMRLFKEIDGQIKPRVLRFKLRC